MVSMCLTVSISAIWFWPTNLEIIARQIGRHFPFWSSTWPGLHFLGTSMTFICFSGPRIQWHYWFAINRTIPRSSSLTSSTSSLASSTPTVRQTGRHLPVESSCSPSLHFVGTSITFLCGTHQHNLEKQNVEHRHRNNLRHFRHWRPHERWQQR